MKLTRQQLIDENTALRVEIERLRNEVRSTKCVAPASSTRRPVRVMSLDREWAFKARAQLARDGSTVACQPVKISGNRTAWMVF